MVGIFFQWNNFGSLLYVYVHRVLMRVMFVMSKMQMFIDIPTLFFLLFHYLFFLYILLVYGVRI